MPNYTYKCSECFATDIMNLPISTPPSKVFVCTVCYGGQMKRTIGINPSATTGLKEFAGDWFKKQYGFEIGERDENRAQEAKQRNKEFEQAKADGVNANPKAHYKPL